MAASPKANYPSSATSRGYPWRRREADKIVSERPRPDLRALPADALDPAPAEPAHAASEAPRRARRALLITSWERRFVALAVAWGVIVLTRDVFELGGDLFEGFGEWVIAVYAFYAAPFVLAALAQVSSAPSLRAGVLAATLAPAAALTLLQDPEFALVFVFLAGAAFAAGRSAGRQFWNLTTPERALIVAGAISVVWVAGLLLLFEGHRGKGEHCWIVATAEDGTATREVFVHGPGEPHRLPRSSPSGAVLDCLPGSIRTLPLIEAALLLVGTGVLALAALRPPQARNHSPRI